MKDASTDHGGDPGEQASTSTLSRRRLLRGGVVLGAGIAYSSSAAASATAEDERTAASGTARYVVTPDRVTGVVSAVGVNAGLLWVGADDSEDAADTAVAVSPDAAVYRGWPSDLSSFTGGEHVTIAGTFAGETFQAREVHTLLRTVAGEVREVSGNRVFTDSATILLTDDTASIGSRGTGEMRRGDSISALVVDDSAAADLVAVQVELTA